MHECKASTRLAALLGAISVYIFLVFGVGLLAYIPNAALAGIIFFVAQRLVRFGTIKKLASQSYAEYSLILATAASIIFAPIQIGMAIGIFLSLLHGVWTISQTRAIGLAKIPGSTVWWPASAKFQGEQVAGVVVVGFQAPLFFVNCEAFRDSLQEILRNMPQPVEAIILETSGIIEVDFSGAQILLEIIKYWKQRGVEFYVARLE